MCPLCGSRTFNYGGGWRCLGSYCDKNTNNPAPNVGPEPSWWFEPINVFKDGDQWCAVHSDFKNLQESIAGFGNTPHDAVINLNLKALNTNTNEQE